MTQRDVVHEARILSGCQSVCLCAYGAEHVGKRVHFRLGIIAQNVAVNPVFMAGMTDAKAHAAKVRAEVLINGAQSVVPGMAAALFHLYLERRQVEFVVEDGEGGYILILDRNCFV